MKRRKHLELIVVMQWLPRSPIPVLLLGVFALAVDGRAQTAASRPALGVSAVVPADAAYVPLTNAERWKLYVEQTFLTPGAYFRTFAVAADQDINGRPREWGQGLIGYSQRAGSNFARFGLFDTYETAAAEALGHEVRYVRCHCSGFLPRFGYALGAVFVTRNRDGQMVPHYARIGAAFASEATALLWYPPSYRNDDVVFRGVLLKLAGRGIMNNLHEFAPEMRRVFHRD
jgi:hypothetical protein